MNYDIYPTEASSSLLQFQFCSEGPKGIIKKQINFQSFPDTPTVFNLAFGDADGSGQINDTIVTDNNDSRKVLATVAITVYKFFEKHKDCSVFASGSTKARTRLYRMGITNNLNDIIKDFEVFGYIRETWEIFEKGRDYEAFLIRKN